MTTSPAYQLLCDLLIAVDGFGRIARRQWLADAGLEPLEAHLPPDLPAIHFAPALLDAAYQQGNDHHLRRLVIALQEVVAGHPDHLHRVTSLVAEPDLVNVVFPEGRVAWVEDRATTLAVAKTYFSTLPTDRVSPHVTPPDVPFPPKSHMPFVANHDFVGRQAEMLEIAGGIKTGHGAVVAGLGGVGKSQLAVEWVHRYGRYFAGGVFWLDFSNADSIPLSIAAAGAAYQYPHYSQMELAAQAAWVREQWKSETPTLLIFDNCEDPEVAEEYAPIGSGARVLITTRDLTLAQMIRARGLHQVNLESLPRPDSIKLLQRLRPDLNDTDAYAIAEEVGDLPLALHIAGSFLQKYRTTSHGNPGTYVERLRQPDLVAQLGKQGERVADLPTKHERDVARTFMLSIARVNAETHPDPGLAFILLLMMAQFAPGVALPLAWLDQLTPGETDELDRVDAIATLLANGLVDSPHEGTIRLHRLVAQTVTGLVEADLRDIAVTLTENAIMDMMPTFEQPDFLGRLEQWLPHARYMTTRAVARRDDQAAYMANTLGFTLDKLGLYEEVRYWYEKDLEISQERYGVHHINTATSLNNVADVYKSLGLFNKAVPLYETALKIKQEVVGADDPGTATVLNNLAELYRVQGQYDRALPYYLEALATYRREFGAHPVTARILNNIGLVYQAQEHYTRAMEVYEEALAMQRQAFTTTHPDIALSTHNLGYLYMVQGHYDRAMPLCEEALKLRRDLLGERHPDTANALHTLATLYRLQGDQEQALPLYEESLAIRQETLGARHLDTAISLNGIGVLYSSAWLHDLALPFFEEAVSIMTDSLGIEHPHTQTMIANLESCKMMLKTTQSTDSIATDEG